MTETMRGRILGKIERTATGCWEWTARRDRDGYGQLNVDNLYESRHGRQCRECRRRARARYRARQTGSTRNHHPTG